MTMQKKINHNMGCLSCFTLEEREKYYEYLSSKYGKEVVDCYRRNWQCRPFSYFDQSKEHKEFCRKRTELLTEIDMDIEACCDRV